MQKHIVAFHEKSDSLPAGGKSFSCSVQYFSYLWHTAGVHTKYTAAFFPVTDAGLIEPQVNLFLKSFITEKWKEHCGLLTANFLKVWLPFGLMTLVLLGPLWRKASRKCSLKSSKCLPFLSVSLFLSLSTVIASLSSSVLGYWLYNRRMRRGRRREEEEEDCRVSAQWAGTFSRLWPVLGDWQQEEEDDEEGRQDERNKLGETKHHSEVRE